MFPPLLIKSYLAPKTQKPPKRYTISMKAIESESQKKLFHWSSPLVEIYDITMSHKP